MCHKVCKLRVGSAKFWCITQFLAWRLLSLALVEADPRTRCPRGFLNDNEPCRSQPKALLGVFSPLREGSQVGEIKSSAVLFQDLTGPCWMTTSSAAFIGSLTGLVNMYGGGFMTLASSPLNGSRKRQSINQLWCDNGRGVRREAANCLSLCPPLWIISRAPTWRRTSGKYSTCNH